MSQIGGPVIIALRAPHANGPTAITAKKPTEILGGLL